MKAQPIGDLPAQDDWDILFGEGAWGAKEDDAWTLFGAPLGEVSQSVGRCIRFKVFGLPSVVLFVLEGGNALRQRNRELGSQAKNKMHELKIAWYIHMLHLMTATRAPRQIEAAEPFGHGRACCSRGENLVETNEVTCCGILTYVLPADMPNHPPFPWYCCVGALLCLCLRDERSGSTLLPGNNLNFQIDTKAHGANIFQPPIHP